MTRIVKRKQIQIGILILIDARVKNEKKTSNLNRIHHFTKLHVCIHICNSIFIDLSFMEEKNRILAEQQERQRIAQQNRLGRTHNYQPFDLNHPPS